MVAQKLQQSLSVFIYLFPPEASKTSGPDIMVSTHSCVEVSEEVEAIGAGYPGYCFIQGLVKLVLLLLRGVEGGGIHT